MATVSFTLDDQPFFLQKDVGDGDPIIYTAADFRRFFAGILPRSGVLGNADFLVTQTPNVGMSILVNSGYANVAGQYLVHLPADTEISLGTFDANPPATRTHKVFLSVYDEQASSVGGYGAKIDVMEDTGAGANYPPSTATASLLLASITVGPNQGNIQNANIDATMRRHGGMASEYTPLTSNLASGFDNAGDGTIGDFRGRRENGRVFLSGGIKRTSGAHFSPGSYDIGTMTSNWRPDRIKYMTAACSPYDPASGGPGGYSWRLSVDKNGAMNARIPADTQPLILYFDGVSYDLD